VLLLKNKVKKANKLELNWNDLFSKQADLVNTKTTQLSEFPIDMSTLKSVTRTIQSIIRDYEAN
jgi:hypothetical protein